MDIDSKSIKIIKAKYWKNGWIDSSKRNLSGSDAEHLSNHGWNFGTVKLSHDQIISDVVEKCRDMSLKDGAALLSQSLSTRKVQDRSFISSVIQASNMPKHSHTTSDRCPICGLYNEVEIDQDVLLFEKLMWGGVRLTNIEYVWLDLKLIDRNCHQKANFEDLINLVMSFEARSDKLSASKFAASLKEVKGNKAEREILCSILGVCNILQHPEHTGFLLKYHPANERQLPNQHFIDLEWPFCWYNSSFGVNKGALEILTNK
ncbi:hypothetical protein [uncultured Microbulbifer sp.]|uniref:hypothetical protein n=1 Tax=uncultured Microbulbifer sp. TaxID=348147 RepID=UPI00261614D2|nr:hypothetical protein [uncultured Microbulbifer sp.]